MYSTEQGEPGYINISRSFMLVRSLLLTIRWTYESVALAIAEITQEVSPAVEEFRTIATILLLMTTGEADKTIS